MKQIRGREEIKEREGYEREDKWERWGEWLERGVDVRGWKGERGREVRERRKK